MKRIKKVILTLFVLIMMLCLFTGCDKCDEFNFHIPTFEEKCVTTEDGFVYYPIENEAYIIKIPETEEVTIPEYIDGKKVVQLGYRDQGLGYMKDYWIDGRHVKQLTIQHDMNYYLTNFTNVETFIDISNSSKLLKAILNTTSLNDFQIKGTINVVASVIGIDINMDIPMLVNVKLIDGKPVIYASFDIPVIGSNEPGFTKINVNNDVPYERGDTSVKSRKLEIYYADNYVYFYRKDVVNQTVFASRTYEKKLKLALEELMSDPMGYILQYGFGFSEDIMAEINKAIEKSLNRETPIDYSKILINYINNDAFQTIVINLAELANNEMLESATLNFYTTLLNNKDYFSKLCFDIYMPIASAFTLNLKTEDLSLVNIGEKVDINNINKFISEYPYKENQMYEASDGDWGLASEKKYTITFVTEYQTAPSTIEASVNSNIVILNLENFVNDDSVTKKSYYFEGWYTSEDYKEQFTSNIMPRGDLTLYAKWSVVTEYYRTLTLLGGLDGKVEITKLEGEYIELPTFTYKQETEGDVTTTYSFQGWQTEDGNMFSSSAMPTENKTLSAVWKVEKKQNFT